MVPVHLILWLASLCLITTGTGLRAAVAAHDTEPTDLDRQVPFALGAGPSVSWTWKKWQDSEQLNVGAAMYLGFVEDKLRLTVGKISFNDEFHGDNYYINIGVNDVPGLVYWGLSGWRGSWWPSKAKW